MIFLLLFIITVFFYIFLPAISISSLPFWLIIISILVVGIIICSDKEDINIVPPTMVLVVLLNIIMIIVIFSSPMFNARNYSERITLKEESFSDSFKINKIEDVPFLDKESAIKVGDKKLGELPDLVSQYRVADDFNQINIKDTSYRVSQLRYAGFFKWMANKSKGIDYYVRINTSNGKTELIRLNKPIKYSPYDMFSRDLKRHLRFSYPTSLLGESHFEVDNDNNAYYITPVFEKSIGILAKEVTSVIVTDVFSGENKVYRVGEIPKWIDRVYPSELVKRQLDDKGLYSDGFSNSLFSKRGVYKTTEGYNYLSMDGDMYFYTGVSSMNEDDSSLGFQLVNLRTKDTKYYKVPVTTEKSAMESSEGAVQEKEYEATFPLLLNVSGNPYYIISLKDKNGLVKCYSLVDASDYQKVYIGSSLNSLIKTFSDDTGLSIEGFTSGKETKDITTENGYVDAIANVVEGGKTKIIFKISNKVHKVDFDLNNNVPFLKVGDRVEVKYNEKNIISIDGINEE